MRTVGGLIDHMPKCQLDRLGEVLGESIFDWFMDLARIVPWLFMNEVGLVEFEAAHVARLDDALAFAEHAFAFWAFPGQVLILEKPASVSVGTTGDDAGKIIDINWTGDALPN